jgi:hypothetical protein
MLQQFIARLQPQSLEPRNAIYGPGTNLDVLWSICSDSGISTGLRTDCYFITEDTVGSNVHEIRSDDSGPNGVGLVVNYGGGAVVVADSDCENNNTDYRRIVVVDDGAGADEIYTTNAIPSAYAKVTFGGAPPATGYDWRAVGCDQNSAIWLIGSAVVNVPPLTSFVYRSTNGTNFTNVAGWPGTTVNEDIQFIKHSNHNVGDLGPDDPGNPHWLVVSATYAYTSADGLTWNGAAHGLGVTPHARSIAYCKTSGRWIWPLSGTPNVAYTEDNGLTWSTWANVLPIQTWNSCKSNFYGTVMAGTVGGSIMALSVNDGDSWSVMSPNIDSGLTSLDYHMIHSAFDPLLKAYEQSYFNEYWVAGATDATPAPNEFEFSRSLRT